MTSTKYDTRRLGHNGQRPTVPNPRAGVTLKAVDALRDRNVQMFTREQVAYLIDLAFLSGAEHRRAFDAAELIATWDVNTTPHRTHEQRVAWEMAEYQRLADLKQAHDEWSGRRAEVEAWRGCDWPEVAVPGGGRAGT